MILPLFFLFNGYLRPRPDGQRLEPYPNGLEILRNRMVFTKRDRSEKEYTPWFTTVRGIFHITDEDFDDRCALYMLDTKIIFQMIPENTLPLLWAAKGEQWLETVNEFFRQNQINGVELRVTKVYKKHLRPPDPNEPGLDSEDFKKWYVDWPEEAPFYGFIIPKTRSIVVAFTSRDYTRTKVALITPDGRTIKAQEVNSFKGLPEFFGVSFSGDKEFLPEGLYKIEVSDLPPSLQLGEKFRTTRSFVFHEHVTFSTRTLVCDLEVILADGISLEESVLNQFPLIFENLVSVGKAEAVARDSEVKSDYPEPPEVLAHWVNRLQWMQGKSKFAAKIFNTNGASPRFKKVAEYVIHGNLDLLGDELKKGLELCYGVYDSAKEWKEFKRKLSVDPAIRKRITKILKSEVDGYFEQNRWFNYMRDAFIENPRNYFASLDLTFMSEKSRRIFLRAGIPEEVSNLQKTLGKSGKVLEKAFIVADTAFSLADSALAVREIIGTKAKLRQTTDTFNDLIKQYQETLSNLPNREGIGNLEKYRAMTVTGVMDVDMKTAEACARAMDTVLGTLTMIPGPQQLLAGLVVLIKDTASLGVEALADLDGWSFFHNHFSAPLDRHAKVSELMKSSYANQELMTDKAASGGLEGGVQFRLRAEALNGLVGLLTRAAISTASDGEYLEKIKKYRVKEYIETFVLNDGWQMPLYPSIPLSMDAVWLYTINPMSLFSDLDFFRSQFGYTKPLTIAAASGLPGAIGMLVGGNVILAKHARAHFHDSFPIHRMEAATVEAFCKCFRPHSGTKLGQDPVAYTRMYRRPHEANAEDPWQPVEPLAGKGIESIPSLSPLDQIRILVVLKEGIEPGIYPISLKLYRTDGMKNLEGPLYQDIVRNLDPFLLPIESEWKGKGRMGCVFYPFYQLGIQTLPGIKPLAGDAVDMVGVWAYYAWGGLWNMTYGFKINFGDDHASEWIKLGGKLDKRNGLDEFPVDLKIYKRPHERRLLIGDFLKSRVTEFSYPILFQNKVEYGPCYLKVADAWYWLGTDAKKEFPHFDWHQPVELIVTFWADNIGIPSYDNAGLDWGHTPLELTLHQASMGLDTKGPTFSSRLTYLGKYHTAKSKHFPFGILNPKGKDIGESLSPLLHALESGNADIKSWFEKEVDKPALLASNTKSESYHLFAAHIPFSYFAPDNHRVQSIRPFAGSMPKEGEAYEYYFSCATPTGIHNLESSARIHFAAPKMDGSTSPWNPSDAKVRHWIEKECEKTDASPEIIAGHT